MPANCVSTQYLCMLSQYFILILLQKNEEDQYLFKIEHEKLKTENEQLKQTLKVLSNNCFSDLTITV